MTSILLNYTVSSWKLMSEGEICPTNFQLHIVTPLSFHNKIRDFYFEKASFSILREKYLLLQPSARVYIGNFYTWEYWFPT